MRTTITLDADVESLVRAAIRERGASFKEIVNQALRSALGGDKRTAPYRVPTADMGVPAVPLDKALRVAADMEDEELLRKLEFRK